MLKHTIFGHDSEEEITHCDACDTVVPFVSYVNSLRSDKPLSGPVGARRWPGACPMIYFFLTKTLILSVLSAHTVNFLNFLFGLRAQSVYFHIFSGHAPLHAHCFLGELEDIF